jgi:hypothetical protein
MAAERELMNARIAALQAGIDRAYRQLIDARGDLTVASGKSDADVVASTKDYVDEAMFEHVSTVNVAEMTPTIEQGLSSLEVAINLIPPAVDAPPVEHDRAGRDEEADAAGGVGRLDLASTTR